MTRRDAVKNGLAVVGLGAAGGFDWVLPALAQEETLVPFTEWPATYNPNPAVDRRTFEVKKTFLEDNSQQPRKVMIS